MSHHCVKSSWSAGRDFLHRILYHKLKMSMFAFVVIQMDKILQVLTQKLGKEVACKHEYAIRRSRVG